MLNVQSIPIHTWGNAKKWPSVDESTDQTNGDSIQRGIDLASSELNTRRDNENVSDPCGKILVCTKCGEEYTEMGKIAPRIAYHRREISEN